MDRLAAGEHPVRVPHDLELAMAALAKSRAELRAALSAQTQPSASEVPRPNGSLPALQQALPRVLAIAIAALVERIQSMALPQPSLAIATLLQAAALVPGAARVAGYRHPWLLCASGLLAGAALVVWRPWRSRRLWSAVLAGAAPQVLSRLLPLLAPQASRTETKAGRPQAPATSQAPVTSPAHHGG